MSRIKILPEILSNKIAAGEVVERPASVVKELIENSIDAKSSRIHIEVDKGGRSLLRVSDNGNGMKPDDALLAIERYATSKISNDSDLFSINSLGFRGEALPSIASVSKFTLVTRDESLSTGTKITIEGGKIKDVIETGAPHGTMISVKQLFYNTPARRKFLKTVNTEMGHIADTVSCIALGWPGIQFRLLHNGKTVKNWPKVTDHFDRITDVLGYETGGQFHKITFSDNRIVVSGWVSSPQVTRTTSRKIHIYVNGRFIKDRGIQHAIFEGYQGRLMKGQFPVAVIFIDMPFGELDVNVHPTKHEVRFANQKDVYEAIKKAVLDIWKIVDKPKWSAGKAAALPKPVPRDVNRQKVIFEKQSVSPPPLNSYPEAQYKAVKNDKTPDVFKDIIPPKTLVSETVSEFRKREENTVSKQEAAISLQKTLWESKQFSDLIVIGQFHNTYILCDSGEELVLVDQHAAHERILFDKLKKKSSATGGVTQKLLLPETIDLGYSEAVLLEKMIPDLEPLGLEIEPFGGRTFVIKSLPALISDREAKPLINEILERVEEIGFVSESGRSGLEKVMDECLILMACHGAIRANQKLSREEMTDLMRQLDQCENSSHCPHGRPTWIRWTTKDLEKSFSRIV